MATEYGLQLGAPATADEVAAVFARAAAAQRLTEADAARFERPGALLRSGVLVSVSRSSPLPFPHPVEEEFGFVPAVHVLFRFDSSADPLEQRRDMIRLVTAALTAFPGDAMLAFGGETVQVLRRDGRLTISERDDFWIPAVVALLPPHDRASLPNL